MVADQRLKVSVLHAMNNTKHVDVDVDGVYERRSKPLCSHLEITLR